MSYYADPQMHQYPLPRQMDFSYPPMQPYPAPIHVYLAPSPSYPSSLSSELSEESSEESSEDEPLDEEHGDPSKPPKSVDKSEALFTMYLDRSDEDDRKTTERWKGECDAILVFTGLFSAALAALLSISVQGLQQNSQDTSAFYLGNIYHLLAGTTGSQPIAHATPSDPPKFSPPTSAVLVNSLWFLSLIMSLTGALLAVFIQQWARSYLQATQERHSPHKRARIRAFHAEGLEKFSLHRVTRAMPILIHVSLFLFFSGLPIFLFNVNRTVFNVVVAWLALCVAGYACITLMPVIYQNSPYYSPISSSIWWCVTNALFILYQFFKFFIPRNSFVLRWYRAHYANSQFRWPSLRAMQKASGRFARKLSSDIDYRALRRMFKTLNEDDEFEHFFDALPSLCESKRLNDAQTAFIKRNKTKLSRALIGMMDRTLLSELVSEEVKQRRIIICTKVIGATSLLESRWTLPHVLFGDWKGFSKSIHFGLFVQDWKDISDPVTAFYAQFVVAVTLASVQERDDRWFELASGQLKESKSFLRNCYLVGDSILLTNAIFIIRRMIQTFCGSGHHRQRDIYILEASLKTLELVCRFDIQNTLEEHQHVFCSLWNQLVDAAQDNIDPHITSICVMILKSIRRLYVTLHGKTAAAVAAGSYGGAAVLGQARTYPRCNSEEHYPSNMVPGLPLHGLQIDAHHVSMDVIRDLTSMLVPVLPPTYTTPYPAVVPNPYYTVAFGPSSSAIPSYYPPNTQSMYYPIHPRSYDPLAPGPYPFVPDSYSYSTAPVPTNTFVSIPQMASSPTRPTRRRGRRRRRRDAPATTNEANLRLEGHEFHAPSHFTPEIPHRRRVGFVGVSSSGSSSPAVPARQEWPAIRSDANISISTPAPTTRTPFVPPLSSLGQFYVPQGPPVGLPDISQRLQVTPDTDSLHSTTDASFATARSASSSPVPSPRRFTGASREGSLAQTPSAMPPVIEVNGYGEFSGLLHYSLHSVLYEGKLYPTALHLFEARKFLPQRPDLAKRIRQCERVDQVASISAELANFVRKDWGNIMLSMMDAVLYLKFRQHSGLRALLFSTYPSELVYLEPRDLFWGGDGENVGRNELGRSLMRVCQRLRTEAGL